MTDAPCGRCLCARRVPALVWRALTLAAGCAGLYPMLFGKSADSNIYWYFTIQTNLMLAALFLALAIGTARQLARGGPRGAAFSLPPWLQSAAVFFIQITFLVYAGLLAGGPFRMEGVMGAANLLVHYAAPLMALADWALFLPHGRLRVRHAALWLVYPALYVAVSFVRAGLGTAFFGGARFPYFFMDADVQGLNLLWICPLFFLGFFALGCLFVWADRALGRVPARAAARASS